MGFCYTSGQIPEMTVLLRLYQGQPDIAGLSGFLICVAGA